MGKTQARQVINQPGQTFVMTQNDVLSSFPKTNVCKHLEKYCKYLHDRGDFQNTLCIVDEYQSYKDKNGKEVSKKNHTTKNFVDKLQYLQWEKDIVEALQNKDAYMERWRPLNWKQVIELGPDPDRKVPRLIRCNEVDPTFRS